MDLGANAELVTVMAEIQDLHSSLSLAQKHKALGGVSPLYKEIVALATRMSNLLPPSGAMAGVIAAVDATRGVWQAPANVSIVGVHGLTMDITDTQQADFNVDPISGKSINVIRRFTGRGILVWGARTLDGNSLDWRYISVRRLMIFIEQSCKRALNAYVFEPNTNNTWVKVQAMVENFLESLFRQGALAGSSAQEAYSVRCGLGITMTNHDILNGLMIVQLSLAPIRPAEFIILQFTQKMAVQP
jgi:phage tail sheath protein FI